MGNKECLTYVNLIVDSTITPKPLIKGLHSRFHNRIVKAFFRCVNINGEALSKGVKNEEPNALRSWYALPYVIHPIQIFWAWICPRLRILEVDKNVKKTMDQKEIEQQMRRFRLMDDFPQIDEQTCKARVERFLEIDKQGIIGNQHFARASAECIDLYSYGHFIATVMVTQSVNEGIIKFVANRNQINRQDIRCDALLPILVSKGIISQGCSEASKQIMKRSFRNDIHHMNPPVGEIDSQTWAKLAKKNIQNLAIVEREIWAINIDDDGKLVPIQPKYWDINSDGTVPAFLRLQ